MKVSALFLLLALCGQEYQVNVLSIPVQNVAKMDMHSRDTADENLASSNEEVRKIAEKSTGVIKAVQDHAEHQHFWNKEGSMLFSHFHNIQKRVPPTTGTEKGVIDYINTLKQWQTFDQNTGQCKITVPNGFKHKEEEGYLYILSHLNLAIPQRYIVSFQLAGKMREVIIGTAPLGVGQVCVYRQETCSPPSYSETIKKLLSKTKLTEQQDIATKLLRSLKNPSDNNAWDGFSVSQENAAVELIVITHIAESVPHLPYINSKSGRTPIMAKFARECLKEIADGNLTFEIVFGNEKKSLYPAVGTGGTERAREATSNPCLEPRAKKPKLSK